MGSIVHAVSVWVIAPVYSFGYWGIVVMMGIGCACIPLPSEIIMAFGGYLVYKDPANFNIWMMGIAGAAGCVLGSVVAYWAGRYGGRPFIEKYGKYVLVRRKDLDKADGWFKRYGDATIFFSRMLPIVRAFISFPAGISGMRFWRFILYTFVGSLPWCLGLACLGKLLGSRWETGLKRYFHGADTAIGVVIVVMIALYVYHHIKSGRDYDEAVT